MCAKFLSGSLKGRDYLEGLNVGGRVILKIHFKGLGSEGVNSIYVAQCID
jgi:hypothetical protein